MLTHIPKLYPDPLGLDDWPVEITEPGRPTIIGPLLQPRAPAPTRVPYHVRYPPVVDDPVCIILGPAVVAQLLTEDETDSVVIDVTDHFDDIPTSERRRL